MIPDEWRELALAPPRAGAVAGAARIRVEPEDFQVDEQLAFTASGAGEHVLLRVRKRQANTGWVARELARLGGVRPFDVGYAGLKDRNAVTTQWFTVPGRKRPAAEWVGACGEGFEVLEAAPHSRKLPRGALAGNRFRIVLRDFQGSGQQLLQRVEAVAAGGVPNYFGPQRFGRELSNLRALLAQHGAGTADGAPGSRRGRPDAFVLSAARSLVFNAVLAGRVRDGTWSRLLPGDCANLDGRNTVFAVTEADQTLAGRAAALEIHPTGPLPGRGDPCCSGDVLRLEQAVAGRYPQAAACVAAAGAEAARRPLRLAVRELRCVIPGDGSCVLEFGLRAGGFATAVLRELIDAESLEEGEHD